jgi:hypothetical protein
MFMSAQQVLGCALGKDSLGRTGVKEARLTANRPNSSRAGSFITGILSQTAISERAGRVDVCQQVCY